MPITDWPLADRPIEKLLQQGERNLTDAELIAIFLKTGTRGKTALDIAKEWLTEFGNLKKLLAAPADLLIKKQGVGFKKYAALKAAVELGKRYLQETIPRGALLTNSQVTQQFVADRLGHYPYEVFACLFMDTHLRLIHFEELFRGTLDEAAIYPREIARRALVLNAAKIILAHNHPSGHPGPSAADQDVTQEIKAALALLDIEVIDHIIVGHPHCFSFADAGII